MEHGDRDSAERRLAMGGISMSQDMMEAALRETTAALQGDAWDIIPVLDSGVDGAVSDAHGALTETVSNLREAVVGELSMRLRSVTSLFGWRSD
mmetsp:Transcript_15755/g.31686  ORF Transcript_15755/g.31686 Transcript_15755/m.31686 type:complete len:94 (+) Transcript_15755:2-283(+)